MNNFRSAAAHALRRSPRLIAMLVGLSLVAACASDRTLAPQAGASLRLTIVSGNGQVGAAGEQLTAPILIRAMRGDKPADREPLSLQVTAGSGQVFSSTVVTDVNGRAAIVWTLGVKAGEPQRLELRWIDPTSGTVANLASLSATARAGRPAKLIALTPVVQRAVLGQSVDSAPSVRVLDRFDNPVPAANISFTPTGNATQLSDSSAVTDSAGVAAVSRWTVLKATNRTELTARAVGTAVSVVFAVSAFGDIDLSALPPLPRLASGTLHTCALNEQGKAFCWGYNGFGVVGAPSTGTGSVRQTATPRLIDSTRTYNAIVSGSDFSCGLVLPAGRVFCWGVAYQGSLGATNAPNSILVDVTSPIEADLPEPLVRISAGGRTVCGVTEAGVAYCWGDGAEGQVGNGRVGGVRRTPAQAALGLRFVDVVVGTAHSCGLRKDGTVYCWGSNEHFRLGYPSTITRAASSAPQLWLPQVSSLAAGLYHTCAITTSDSTAVCWGGNFDGQLGDGTGWSSQEPVSVFGNHRFLQLTAGDSHSCGIRVDQQILCWGGNEDGNLGDGTLITRVVPVLVKSDQKFQGLTRRCAVSDKGAFWCWGSNLYYQTSFSAATTPRTQPVRVVLPL